MKDKAKRLGHALLQSNGDTGVVTEVGASAVTILRDDGATIRVDMFTIGNVEAARKAGLAIEQSVAKAQQTEPFVSLTAIKEERLPITKSEALMNQ